MDRYDGVLNYNRIKYSLEFFLSFLNLPVKNDNLGRYWTDRSKRRFDGRLWDNSKDGWTRSSSWNEFSRDESEGISGVRTFKMTALDTSEHHKPWKRHPIFNERMFGHTSLLAERDVDSKLFPSEKLLELILDFSKRQRWDRIHVIPNTNVKNEDVSSENNGSERMKVQIGEKTFYVEFCENSVRSYKVGKFHNYSFESSSMDSMFQVIFNLYEEEKSEIIFGYIVLESSLCWKYLEKGSNDSFLLFGHLITPNEIKYLETTGWIFEGIDFKEHDMMDDDRALFLNRLLLRYSKMFETSNTENLSKYLSHECSISSVEVDFSNKGPNLMGMYLPPDRSLKMQLREGVKHPKVKNIRLPPNKFCFHCGKYYKSRANKLMKCSRCKFTYYCSQNCQKADWRKYHKQICSVRKSTFVMSEENEEMRVHAELTPRLAEYVAQNPGIKEYPDFLFRTEEERKAKLFFDFSLKMKELEKYPPDEKKRITDNLLGILESKVGNQK